VTSSDQLDNSPYVLHQLALAPLLPGASEKSIIQASSLLPLVGETTFLSFLEHHGLHALWHEVIIASDHLSNFPESFVEQLHQHRLATTGHYLLQKNALAEVKALLDAEDVIHATMKGAHTRELLYKDPSCRPACDIDILISRQDINRTASILNEAGYRVAINADNIGHEASFTKSAIDIDLHWDILRTGRTRIPLAESFLSTRTEHQTHWGLNNEATLFMLMVHPVFTKYATSANSALVRVLDLILWMKEKEIDWDKTYDLLDIAGNKTTAWIMLEWLHQLGWDSVSETLIDKLRPGVLRKAYLQRWIQRNYSDRFLNTPVINQLMFTLPAHDKVGDAIHAVVNLIKEKREAKSKSRKLTESLDNLKDSKVI
jgi:hypothetical protein